MKGILFKIQWHLSFLADNSLLIKSEDSELKESILNNYLCNERGKKRKYNVGY